MPTALEPPPQPPMLADRPAVAPASKLQCQSCGDSKVLSKSRLNSSLIKSLTYRDAQKQVLMSPVERGGVESYDVHYLIGNRHEKKLPPTILSERIAHEGRPRRSSLSAEAGA
jgi:hypothetical protein